MPDIAALQARHKEEGLEVICVNSGITADAARAFAKERGIPPDLLVLTRPGEGEPEELYRADWPPVAYVVGRDGKILAAEIGYVGFFRAENGTVSRRFQKSGSDDAPCWMDELPFVETVRRALESKK